jgi:hypothetical protein
VLWIATANGVSKYVFPRQFGKAVPAIDWEADEQDLVNQLKQVTDADVREILERELWSYRQLFASVGRSDLVERLVDVRGKAYRWSSLKGGGIHRNPWFGRRRQGNPRCAARAWKSMPVGSWNTRRSNCPIAATRWSKMSAWMASYSGHSTVLVNA